MLVQIAIFHILMYEGLLVILVTISNKRNQVSMMNNHQELCLYFKPVLQFSWMKIFSCMSHVITGSQFQFKKIKNKNSSNSETGCNFLYNLSLKFLIALVWWRREQFNSYLNFIFQFTKVHFTKSSSSNDGFEVISNAHNLRVAIPLILWSDIGFGNHTYNKEDFQ